MTWPYYTKPNKSIKIIFGMKRMSGGMQGSPAYDSFNTRSLTGIWQNTITWRGNYCSSNVFKTDTFAARLSKQLKHPFQLFMTSNCLAFVLLWRWKDHGLLYWRGQLTKTISCVEKFCGPSVGNSKDFFS